MEGQIATSEQRYGDAEVSYHKARKFAERYGIPDRLYDAHMGMAENYMAAGSASESRESLLEAIDVLESQRLRVGSPHLRASLMAEHGDPYDRLIESYFEQYDRLRHADAEGAAGMLDLAIQTVERSRNRVFREQLGDRTDPGNTRETLASAIARHEYLLQEHAGGADSDAGLLDSNESISRFVAGMLSGRAHAGTRGERSPTISEIQQMLRANDVLVSYWISRRMARLIAIRKASVSVFQLPHPDLIEAQVDELLSYLTEPGRDPAEMGRRLDGLRDKVLPSGLAVDNDTIAFVQTDGPLHAIPVSLILPSGIRSARMFSISPSGTSRGSPPMTSLVIVNSASADVGTFDRLRPGRQSTFGRLPYLDRELTAVRRGLGDPDAEFRLESAALKAELLTRQTQHFDTVHIAAHALAHPVFPGLSWIQFADGKLYAAEIEQASINARLIVLSACETAVGKRVSREGVFGLTRSFLVAGADNVISTLWQIPDHATAAFFEEFYAHPRHHRDAVIEALHLAQNKVRGIDRWRHPYYWSSFEIWMRSPFETSVTGVKWHGDPNEVGDSGITAGPGR